MQPLRSSCLTPLLYEMAEAAGWMRCFSMGEETAVNEIVIGSASAQGEAVVALRRSLAPVLSSRWDAVVDWARPWREAIGCECSMESC